MARPAADVIEDLQFLSDTGVGALEAAERSGFATAHAMEKWLARHDQLELWRTLKARDPEGAHTNEGIGRRRFDGIGGTGRIDSLLVQAGNSPLTRTQKRGQKIRELIDELAAILAVEQVEIAEKAEARKEVERLERQLAQAKAKLRRPSTTRPLRSVAASSDGPTAAAIRAWAAETGFSCSPQGRIAATVRDAYLAAHELEATA